MVNLGNDEIVKYPFLAEAGKYLSDKGFSLEQFGTDPDLKKIRCAALPSLFLWRPPAAERLVRENHPRPK